MVGGYLADALGVPPDRESIKAVPLDKLVQAASDLVVEVQTTPDPARWGQLALSLLPFAPTVDGSVLPAAPLASHRDRPGRRRPAADRIESRRSAAVPGRGGHHRPHRRTDAGRRRPARTGSPRTISPSTGQPAGCQRGRHPGRRDHRLVLPHPAHPGRRGPGRVVGTSQHLDVPVRPPGTAGQPAGSGPATGSRSRSCSTRSRVTRSVR